ncbi:MAG: hypothetical protein HUU15_14505, partial [Candidatus Brocadiae bacterium]|nr:hypothetical protein [Candidatus Brocadiia bacterium]
MSRAALRKPASSAAGLRRCLIGGTWAGSDSGASLDVRDPATGAASFRIRNEGDGDLPDLILAVVFAV